MNTYRLRQLRAAAKEHLRLIPVREGGCVLRIGETFVAVFTNTSKARTELAARRREWILNQIKPKRYERF
jgi:hypothetical protein